MRRLFANSLVVARQWCFEAARPLSYPGNEMNQTAGTSPAIDHILVSAVVTLRLHAASAVHLVLLSPILIPLLLIGAVAAIETAGCGAEHAMMTGVVTGDATDQRSLDAAPGLGGLRRRQREYGNR
jgi:hypothetical protein